MYSFIFGTRDSYDQHPYNYIRLDFNSKSCQTFGLPILPLHLKKKLLTMKLKLWILDKLNEHLLPDYLLVTIFILKFNLN